jgi:lipopolysaccharide transport system ATP-binding protein
MSTLASSIPSDDATAQRIEYAIDICGLSKSFKRQTRKAGYTTLKSWMVSQILGRKKRVQDSVATEHSAATEDCAATQDSAAAKGSAVITAAIRNLTLRIPRGASVGIIGRNGSGKSTFLKLVTGIYKADAGTLRVNGRVAALIELGAGFHPDFTGRENLMLAGIMHGLTPQQVQARFSDIVRFAELESVIDDPVRTYSSGMFMRLGFSLAVHTDPDVLLVDEVLAVGDAAFVAKCKERIAELRRMGKTLLLVTHDLEAVQRWCDEVLWLHDGEVRDRGDPRRVLDHYRQFVERGAEEQLGELNRAQQAQETATIEHVVPVHGEGAGSGEAVASSRRWGSREIEITGVRILDTNGVPRLLFHPEDGLSIEISYLQHEPVKELVFGIGIERGDGLFVHGSNTQIEEVKLPKLAKKGILRYEVKRLGLLDGEYHLDVAVHREDGYPYDYHKRVIVFGVRAPHKQLGVMLPSHEWVFM